MLTISIAIMAIESLILIVFACFSLNAWLCSHRYVVSYSLKYSYLNLSCLGYLFVAYCFMVGRRVVGAAGLVLGCARQLETE